MALEQFVGLARLLVALMFFLARSAFDVLLLRGVSLNRLLNGGRDRFADRDPRRAHRILHCALDPLRLVIRPLVRGLRLQAPRLRFQHERFVDSTAGAQRGDGAERGEQRGGQGDVAQQRIGRRFLNRFPDTIDVDFRFFGHERS